jgi:hydrogenase/urease accessory protein HupE
MNRCCLPALVSVSLAILSPALQAHVSAGGIVDSYGGLLHPYTEPVHIITLLGLGFMLTQQAKQVPPYGWMMFCIAALCGLIASSFNTTFSLAPLLLVIAILLGLLVATRLSLPVRFCIFLSIVAGFVLGLDSAPGSATIWTEIVAIISTTTGLGIALLIVIGWGDYFRKEWQKIGIRVIGSWIAASALLVLVLNLKQS